GGGGSSSTGAGGTTSTPEHITVTISAPTDGATIPTTSDITVMATVVEDMGSNFIDTSSVKVTLTAMGSTTVVANGQLVANGNDVYAGAISIGTLQTGLYTLTVSGKSQSGATGMSSVNVMIQGGPTLIVNSPAQNQAYSDSFTIEVFVDPGAMAPTALL